VLFRFSGLNRVTSSKNEPLGRGNLDNFAGEPELSILGGLSVFQDSIQIFQFGESGSFYQI